MNEQIFVIKNDQIYVKDVVLSLNFVWEHDKSFQ